MLHQLDLKEILSQRKDKSQVRKLLIGDSLKLSWLLVMGCPLVPIS